MTKKIGLLALGLSMALLSGCGGGSSTEGSSTEGSSTGGSSTNPVQSDVNKAYYLDSAVEGAEYVCGSKSGLTDSEGAFYFEENKECTLAVGDIILRRIYPSDLRAEAVYFETNITVARFLQSIDMDGINDNGLQISSEVKKVLSEENS